MSQPLDLSNLSSAHVLVIGDIMLDSYVAGNTQRISPEAPVPIVHIHDRYHRPGGAANVALNVAALGAKASLVGLIGQDDNGQTLLDALAEKGVQADLVSTGQANTITKLRIMSRNQQLIRLDTEDGFIHVDHTDLLSQAKASITQASVVILSDYGKGTLGPILPALIAHCKALGKPVLVDPKGKDFTIYRGATLLTPNMSEFEAVAGATADEDTFSERARDMIAQCELDSLLVTRSEKGMTLFQSGAEPFSLPAQVREVYDVTGAGDTVIATLATAMAGGYSLHDATNLANIAAGIVVGKMGTATTSQSELQAALVASEHSKVLNRSGIMDLETLLQQVKLARLRGETIVMTNGCFDILHAGHVHYLNEARKLGDRLIVAVNGDESVRRLKGETRPINGLEDRMAVLAALGCVDWVIPFDEDTPLKWIEAVVPDKLVKGGDYIPEDIVGYDCVTQAGGQVLVIDLVEGRSTTRIIERINQS